MTESKNWARKQAKALKSFLKANGIETKHALCLEAVAHMNGASNWQTFEASTDADIVVNDPNALRGLAQVALQATLFTALPEGVTLNSMLDSLREAKAAEESGEEWQAMKGRMNRIWDGTRTRSLNVAPIKLPEVVDQALLAIASAMAEYFKTKKSSTSNEAPVVFERSMQNWELLAGEAVDPIDARTYALKIRSDEYSTHFAVTFPHKDVDSLDEASPQLAGMLEVNKGLPCLHIYSDVYAGEALVTVFAAKNGELLVRFNKQPDATELHPLKGKLGLDSESASLR